MFCNWNVVGNKQVSIGEQWLTAALQDPDSSSLPDEDYCGELGVSAVSPQKNGPLGARQGHRCTRSESQGEGNSFKRTFSSQSGLYP